MLDISVIIPFRDRAKMTLQCVRTLISHNPSLKEVLLINNGSSESELSIIRDGIADKPNVAIHDYNHPFNYQKMNNWAVSRSKGKFIFFLNNDTEFTAESKGLLESMHKKALEKDVGMVGCLLLYGDQKTIQHAGVFIRPGILGDHIYVGRILKKALSLAGTEEYPYDISKSRPLTAVTGAAQIVERRKFDGVKGFDENFIICGGDVDLCIRLNTAGYQTWYVAGGYIVHKESQSRAYKPVPYNDFYYSYKSYIKGYDLKVGDPFVPKITEKMS